MFRAICKIYNNLKNPSEKIRRIFSPYLTLADEPTSNLDKIVEKQILRNLIENKESTMIIVTHDLSFDSAVSRVICFNNGEVVGDGAHVDLLRENTYYKTLYNYSRRN